MKNRTTSLKSALYALFCVTALALTSVAATSQSATSAEPRHGAMSYPLSRAKACKDLGVTDWPGGASGNAACNAAYAAGGGWEAGARPFNNWNEISPEPGFWDAAGGYSRIRQNVPDGELCSAGRAFNRGLDLARADWPTTQLRSGGEDTFTFRATAAHHDYVLEIYVTKDGYVPTQRLTWGDLEKVPFFITNGATLRDGDNLFHVTLPNKHGKHLLYSVYSGNNAQGGESFNSCMDVDFT